MNGEDKRSVSFDTQTIWDLFGTTKCEHSETTSTKEVDFVLEKGEVVVRG